MATDSKQKTAEANGRLWGAHARDWADVQEPQIRCVYDAVRKAYTSALERFRQSGGSYQIGATFRCLFTRA